MQANLSAVVITNNAKDTIGRCLEALLQVTDDVVVVDSGSTDGTKEICLSLPIRYFEKEWEGYSANKNYGDDQAKNDYILSIDSDEILSDELISSIKSEFQKTELADAYKIRFLTNFCGQWIHYGGWNPDWHVRIFNKQKIQWQVLDVHELLSIDKTHTIRKINGKVLHYSFKSIEQFDKKTELYSTLFAQRSLASGKKYSFLMPYVSPVFRFLSDYVLKLGFLDGYYGLVIALGNTKYTYLKYKNYEQLLSKRD